MKAFRTIVSVLLLLFAPREAVQAATLTLSWDPSPDPDVIAYNLYYGRASQEYTQVVPVGQSTTVTLTNLADGVDYFLAATSLNSTGEESDFSEEASLVVSSPETVHLDNLSQVYDGSPRAVSVATEPAGLAVKVTYNGANVPPTEAGDYTVSATIDDPFYSGKAMGTLVVAQASGAIILRDLDQIYDGSPKQVWAMTDPPGVVLQLTYDGSYDWPVDAGTYEVTATIDDRNYAGTKTVSLLILKADIPLSLTNLDQVYDGTPKSVLPSPIPTNASVLITYDGTPNPPTAAGNYLVKAKLLGLSNYTGSATATLSVAKADATLQLADLDQFYDGTPKSVTVITTPSGLTVNLTYNSQLLIPSASGAYQVSAIVDDLNWQGAAQSVLTISPRLPGGLTRNPNESSAPPRLNNPMVTAFRSPSVIVYWPPSTNDVTLWQSTDLAQWVPVRSLRGTSNSAAVPESTGPVFFRATSTNSDQVNPIPLSIRKP